MTKEVCLVCAKFINIGHFIVECCECDSPMHHKCYMKSVGTNRQCEEFYCPKCVHLAVIRYNPFRLICSDMNETENSEENRKKDEPDGKPDTASRRRRGRGVRFGHRIRWRRRSHNLATAETPRALTEALHRTAEPPRAPIEAVQMCCRCVKLLGSGDPYPLPPIT